MEPYTCSTGYALGVTSGLGRQIGDSARMRIGQLLGSGTWSAGLCVGCYKGFGQIGNSITIGNAQWMGPDTRSMGF